MPDRGPLSSDRFISRMLWPGSLNRRFGSVFSYLLLNKLNSRRTNMLPLLFDRVAFSFDEAPEELFKDLTLHFPAGWTGIVGSNGAGKTTLLRLATGLLAATDGRVHRNGPGLYCPQRTDFAPDGFDSLVADPGGEACRIRGLLGVDTDWAGRWDTLSHGERKRAQIAVMLHREPHVLAVDEPTNHLDAGARDMLFAALAEFRGVGLLVSHDRALLDALCTQCLFLDAGKAVMRPGNYTEGSEQQHLEHEYAREQFGQTRRELKRLEREVARRRELASRSHQLRSKRGLDLWDHDARYRRNIARHSGKDGAAGRRMNQLIGRLEHARQAHGEIQPPGIRRLGIYLEGSLSPRDRLFMIEESTLELGEGRALHVPPLLMRNRDRVALVGPNGTGKSTLIRHIVRLSGVPEEHLVYLPQELDEAASARLLADARRLPRADLAHLMIIVSRLGSDPERLLVSINPSPGEARKLLLALGVTRRPYLIIMDEPTNHLDLPSIECLEAALEACPCGLLLVSHDDTFLRRLTPTTWRISAKTKAADPRLTIG
jgi:macrolide transport system ATP-binding/permease protein